MTQLLAIRWQDIYGKRLWTHVQIVDDSLGGDVVRGLAAHSDSGIWYTALGTIAVVSTSGVAGKYNRVYDLAVLSFCTAGGTNINVALPGPSEDIFRPDDSTVDETTITDLTGAVLGTVCDLLGNPVTTYRGGVRIGRGQRDW